MDLLGEVLLSLRLLAGRIGIINFCSECGVEMPAAEARTVTGTAVIEGSCWVEAENRPPTRLHPGDTLLTMGGTWASLRSSRYAPVTVLSDFHSVNGIPPLDIRHQHVDDRAEITIGAGPPRTRVVVFELIAEDDGPTAMLHTFPPNLLLCAEGGRRPPWVSMALTFLATESRGQPGYAASATKLVEFVFIDMLRTHLLRDETLGPSWMRGLRDRQIGKAVAAIHARAAEPWTVESLAREAGLSRSTFIRRFVALFGQPPVNYLADFRMRLAFARLAAGRQSVAAVAEALGYRSESAFRQAFKARFGTTPRQHAKHAV